jgi:coenzyme F420 hydrogenase subunit beta
MAVALDLEGIVAHGLCAGCGLCASLAGPERLHMAVTSAGRMRPQPEAALGAETLERIREVCPGLRATGADPRQLGTEGAFHPVWGPIRSIQRGWAADPDVRFRSAAGGSLTALGVFLLESGAVEAILHVRASSRAPLLTDAQVSTTPAQVRSAARSRYGPAAPLVHVHRLLDEGRRFAVVGKPCDVAAIRNLARVDERVEAQIPYCLTIFCGGVPTHQTARRIAAHWGVREEEIAEFRWRGFGWPGPTHVETRDGRVFDLTYEQAWYDDSVPWRYDLQYRCKICPDAIGELGDVTCPDGWVMRNGVPIHEEAPGQNLLIARTRSGEHLVARAAAAGALELRPFELKELDAMHADHLPRKLSHPARVAALRVLGEPAPRFERFRRWRMLLRAGPYRSLHAFAGSLRRIRAGSHREPLR